MYLKLLLSINCYDHTVIIIILLSSYFYHSLYIHQLLFFMYLFKVLKEFLNYLKVIDIYMQELENST